MLDDINVVVVPRINPDGSYLFTRATYQGFDMNRDHMALKAPELAYLHTAYRYFMPEVAIDFHEFGFYGVTEDGYMRNADDLQVTPATSLNDDERVTQLGLDAVDALHRNAEDSGLRVYHYGITVNNPIGRAYYGLYNSLSVLVETRGIGGGATYFPRREYSQKLSPHGGCGRRPPSGDCGRRGLQFRRYCGSAPGGLWRHPVCHPPDPVSIQRRRQ